MIQIVKNNCTIALETACLVGGDEPVKPSLIVYSPAHRQRSPNNFLKYLA